ncbi:MAG: hypothetical protein AMXMBFR84_35250 [Candidatus Hydrogenedentota bacterium]
MTTVLPADKRDFECWNQAPYRPDSSDHAHTEGSGEHYLPPYWMGRYYGLNAVPLK